MSRRAGGLDRDPADGEIEELNRGRGGKLEPAIAELCLDLQRAPGIAGDEKLRRNRKDVLDLAGPDLVGALRLDEIVDAGAAAALLGVGDLEERQARNGPEELARLLDDPLGVPQVTGIVH